MNAWFNQFHSTFFPWRWTFAADVIYCWDDLPVMQATMSTAPKEAWLTTTIESSSFISFFIHKQILKWSGAAAFLPAIQYQYPIS